MTEAIAKIGLNALGPPVILILLSLWVLLGSAFIPKERQHYSGIFSLIGIASIIFYSFSLYGKDLIAFYGAVTLNPFSFLLWMVFLLIALFVVMVSLKYTREIDIQQAEYYFFLLSATTGLLLLVSSSDLVMLFISIEILSVAAYILTGIRRGRLSAEASFKYFILGSFGAAVLLMGIALVYGATGSVNLKVIKLVFHRLPFTPLLTAGFCFVIIGFAFKVALVPFHMWVPDVYEGAPSSVAGFMASAVKAGGVIALLRVFSSVGGNEYITLFWWFSALTMILGNLMALPQTSLKRLLAYSSIAHAGYIMVGFLGRDTGVSGILFYIVVYSIATVGAFSVVLAVEKEEKGASLKDIAGLSEKHPLLSVSMSIFVLSLAGIPPLAGFFGKFYLFSSAVKAGHTDIVIIAVLMSAVSLYYYLRIVVSMYMREQESEISPIQSLALDSAIFILMLSSLILGLASSPFIELARKAAGFML